MGTETLVQRAQKPPRRFRLRVGEGANRAPQIEWQTRTIVSEYGFTTFGTENAVHELRQVVSVDGKSVKSKGPEELAKLILAQDDARKRALRMVVLEVRPSNVEARALYESFGFRVVGR